MAQVAKFSSRSDFEKHVSQSASLAHGGANSFYVKGAHVASSSGVVDAGKPVKLNAVGKIDDTMIPISGGMLSHDILGATYHGDVNSGSVVKGALITGQGSPAKWTLFALGSVGKVVKSNGVDVTWAFVDWSEITNRPSGLPPLAHNLLNTAYHLDTTSANPLRGALITGQGIPATWHRYALGTAGKILRSDGTDLLYSSATYPDVATTTGSYLRADGTNWIHSTLILPNSATQGDLIVATGANTWGAVTAGTVLQILVGGGAGTVPAWGTDLPTAVTIGAAYIYRVGGTDVNVANGGTGVSTLALNGVIYGNGASAVGVTAIGAEGQILMVGASPFVPAWTTATYPATTTINQLLYSGTANIVSGLATGNSGILVTSAGGVPSIATDIPTAVTIGGQYVYRVSGTDVAVADGGTNKSVWVVGDIVHATGTTTLAGLAAVAVGSYIRSGGVGVISLWSTLILPNAATQGDTVVATGTNTWGAVTAGAAGKIYRAAGVGTVPAWSTATYPDTATTAGAYLRADGTNWITSTLVLPNAGTIYRLAVYSAANTLGELAAVGATGQILIGNTTALPSWSAAPTLNTSLTVPLILATAAHTLNPTTDLIFTPVSNLVKTTTGVRIQSDNYASQTTGWGVSYAGAGDFRYLYADELHAKAFIADLEQALAGGQIICKSVAPLAAVFTIPAAGGNATLVVESFKGFDSFKVFVDGDFVRLRQFDRTGTSLTIANCWGTVVWVSTDTTAKTQTYTFTRSAAPNAGTASGTIGVGVLALDYGTTGNGFLESTAIDGAMADNAPYHQIVSWATHPNSGLTVRTRLGNLKGIFSVSNEYGLYAGAGITDASAFLRISDQGAEMHNLTLKMYDGAVNSVILSPGAGPYLGIGNPAPTSYGNNVGIWLGTAASVAKFSLYASATNYLQFDGTNLSVKTPYVTIDANGVTVPMGSSFSGNNAYEFTPVAGSSAGFYSYRNALAPTTQNIVIYNYGASADTMDFSATYLHAYSADAGGTTHAQIKLWTGKAGLNEIDFYLHDDEGTAGAFAFNGGPIKVDHIGEYTGSHSVTFNNDIIVPTGVKLRVADLTDGYIPYHKTDADGLANSPIRTDGTRVNIGSLDVYRALFTVYGSANISWATTGDAAGNFLVGRYQNSGLAIGSVRGAGTTGYTWLQAQILDAANYVNDIVLQPLGGSVLIGATAGSGKLTIAGDINDITSAGASQLQIIGTTDNTKNMLIGIDTTSGYMFIQGLDRGVDWTAYPLALQPIGGSVLIGATAAVGTELLRVNGAIYTDTTIRCKDLTDGYIPYHVSDAAGLGNSAIWSSATQVAIGAAAMVGTESLYIAGDNMRLGYAHAATNVSFTINGVVNKAARIYFLQSGVEKWIIGNGAASEDNKFAIYNGAVGHAMIIDNVTNTMALVTDGGGSVLIGATARGFGDEKVYIHGEAAADGLVVYAGATTGTGDYPLVIRAHDATNQFYITSDGNATLRGTLTDASDKRLKKNIAYLNGGLASILALKPARYDRTDNGAVNQIGLVAQDVQAFIPEAVREGNGKILGIAYNVITVRMVGAIQELNTKITAQGVEIELLKKASILRNL